MTHPRIPATDVLADSLASSAALATKTKQILEKYISKISVELNRADTVLARKSELIRQTLEIQAVLNQNVESLGRLLHKPLASAPADTSVTPTSEDVLRKLSRASGPVGGNYEHPARRLIPLWQWCKRLTRHTFASSKSETIRITPAMAPGIRITCGH
jgi:hypothetical protein